MLMFALRELVLLPLLDWSGACFDALTLGLRAPSAASAPLPSPFE